MSDYYPDYRDVSSSFWRWLPWFSAKEMACSHCGAIEIVPEFMDKLVSVRLACGFPFPVTSGTRCAEYDTQIGGKGVHPTGEAVDLGLYGEHAKNVVRYASLMGFMGFGIKQHGPHEKRFIHLDTLDCERYPLHPRPWMWSYK